MNLTQKMNNMSALTLIQIVFGFGLLVTLVTILLNIDDLVRYLRIRSM